MTGSSGSRVMHSVLVDSGSSVVVSKSSSDVVSSTCFGGLVV